MITGFATAAAGVAYTMSEELMSDHAPFTYAFTANPYLTPLVRPVTYIPVAVL